MTLEENEYNKLKQKELAEIERLNDIECMKEYTRILDKQDEDRANYFSSKAKKINDCMTNMANTVIKDNNRKLQEEEEKTKRYQDLKNKQY